MKAVKKCSYILFLGSRSSPGVIFRVSVAGSIQRVFLPPSVFSPGSHCVLRYPRMFLSGRPGSGEISPHPAHPDTDSGSSGAALAIHLPGGRAPASGLSTETNSLIRIYLHTSGSSHSELMLNGELLLVNPLTYRGDSVTYRPEGDSLAQYQALSAFLQSCME